MYVNTDNINYANKTLSLCMYVCMYVCIYLCMYNMYVGSYVFMWQCNFFFVMLLYYYQVCMYVCRFIRNCFLSWIYKREQMVLIIQNFFHIIKAKRLLYFKKGWVNYPTMFYNAAVAIQKIMRAFLARRFYDAKFKEFLFRR